ncbi:MAG: stage sporulation protein [Oscillospiraceae bacterium]|nr:stage sporulation protein [Oscillospiraceae bacterium]
MKKAPLHPIRKIARRGLALCLTLSALWMVWLTADLPAVSDLGQTLGQSADFVTTALSLELGTGGSSDSTLSGLDTWQSLLLGQSVRLQAGVSSIAQDSDKQTQDDSAQTDTSDASQTDTNTDTTSQSSEDDSEANPQNSATNANIVAKTILPVSADGYDCADGIYIKNYTDYDIDVDALLKQPLSLDLSQGSPQVLIIHTHTTESYAMDGTDVYEESGTARTLDENYSVVRVGNEVADIFTQLGISVIHDTEYYDYPNYNGAYSRSAEAIESYLEQYPSIKIIIDLHRDALTDSDGTIYKTVTTIDGVETAQVDLIIGTDANGQEHPNWRENLAFAEKIQQSMNNLYPTLARPIALCKSRYNQSYSVGAFLVEIGTHGNTLQEALAGARLFARSAAQVLLDLT